MKFSALLPLFAVTLAKRPFNCGWSPVDPEVTFRIVGGKLAKPYAWPWQGVFCQKVWGDCSLVCGSTLIAPQWAMTAAHCVYGQTSAPFLFKVKFGVYVESRDSENGEVVSEIDSIHMHPNYKGQTGDHDIALLKLKSPVAFTEHIQPVCLPRTDADVLRHGTQFYVTGFGTTAFQGVDSAALKQVKVPFVDQLACDFDYLGTIQNDVMFCAGEAGSDSCQGDSGGPLVYKKQGQWFQYGIVSSGAGCALPGKPGIYSRVTHYCDFISQTTGMDLCSDQLNNGDLAVSNLRVSPNSGTTISTSYIGLLLAFALLFLIL